MSLVSIAVTTDSVCDPRNNSPRQRKQFFCDEVCGHTQRAEQRRRKQINADRRLFCSWRGVKRQDERQEPHDNHGDEKPLLEVHGVDFQPQAKKYPRVRLFLTTIANVNV